MPVYLSAFKQVCTGKKEKRYHRATLMCPFPNFCFLALCTRLWTNCCLKLIQVAVARNELENWLNKTMKNENHPWHFTKVWIHHCSWLIRVLNWLAAYTVVNNNFINYTSPFWDSYCFHIDSWVRKPVTSPTTPWGNAVDLQAECTFPDDP